MKSYSYLTVFRFFKFNLYLSYLEICLNRHLTCLIIDVSKSYIIRFSNHRMTRYFSLYILLIMKFFTYFAYFYTTLYQCVCLSICSRDMYYSLLDSSRQGASNEGRIMSLASPDEKLF